MAPGRSPVTSKKWSSRARHGPSRPATPLPDAIPRATAAASRRVVPHGSVPGSSPNKAYGDAKLANILFTKELHERFHSRGLSSVAFHPGNVATNFASDTDSHFQRAYHGVLRTFLISPDQGGARLRHFIEGEPGQAWRSGEYYGAPGRIGRTNRQVYEAGITAEHWRRSAAMLRIDW